MIRKLVSVLTTLLGLIALISVIFVIALMAYRLLMPINIILPMINVCSYI